MEDEEPDAAKHYCDAKEYMRQAIVSMDEAIAGLERTLQDLREIESSHEETEIETHNPYRAPVYPGFPHPKRVVEDNLWPVGIGALALAIVGLIYWLQG